MMHLGGDLITKVRSALLEVESHKAPLVSLPHPAPVNLNQDASTTINCLTICVNLQETHLACHVQCMGELHHL